MGMSQSIPMTTEEMGSLRRSTGLSETLIKDLFNRFRQLDRGEKGYLTRTDLIALDRLVANPCGDRIIDLFFQNGDAGGNTLNFEQFLKTMVTFRPIKPGDNEDAPNNRKAKLAFAFRMYDLDGDGEISKDEILAMLAMMVGDGVSSEQLQLIAARAIEEVDENTDGTMNFDEYMTIMDRIDVEQKMSIKYLE